MAFADLQDGVAELFEEAATAGARYWTASFALGAEFETDGDIARRLGDKARYWLETLALRDRRLRYRIEPVQGYRVPKQVAAVRSFWRGARWGTRGRIWTPEEEYRLMLLAVGEELAWDDIAEALGRTKSACVTRYADLKARMQLTIHRLGARHAA